MNIGFIIVVAILLVLLFRSGWDAPYVWGGGGLLTVVLLLLVLWALGLIGPVHVHGWR